jgi:hypothetical protein
MTQTSQPIVFMSESIPAESHCWLSSCFTDSTLARKRNPHNCYHSKRRLADTPSLLGTIETRASRNSPSLAAALNCRVGSSSLNADVIALERLHTSHGPRPLCLLPTTSHALSDW